MNRNGIQNKTICLEDNALTTS